MIVLEFKSGPNAGLRVELDKDSIVLGRSRKEADLVVIDDRASKRHARLTHRAGEYILEDLGSSNGTSLGSPGASVIEGQVRIRPGQSFSIGMTELLLVEETPEPVPDDADATILDLRAVPRRDFDIRYQTSLVVVQESDCVVINTLDAEGDPAEVMAPYDGWGRLRFLTGPHMDRYIFLGRLRVMLGRSEDNHASLYDPLVAEHHAVVFRENDDFYLRGVADASVLLNGAPVSEARVLGHGDIISIGASDIEFQAPGIDIERDDPMATVAVPMPRFTFAGEVRMQPELSIGRDPQSDLFLDDRRVERSHAQIYFSYPEFRVVDLSTAGTYVNGKRAVDEPLETGDAIQLGGFELRVDVQALRCSLEVVPPEADVEIPKFVQDVEVASPFMTMYRLPTDLAGPKDAPEGAAPRSEEEAKKDRKSVLWVEPDDVKRSARLPLVIGVGVMASLALTYLSFAQAGSRALLSRPVSSEHASAAFLQEASAKLEASDSCAACHTSKDTVVAACTTCHAAHALRPKHEDLEGKCNDCHAEHVHGPRQTALVDGARCVACHADRHQRFEPFDFGKFQVKPPPREGFAVDIEADLAFEPEARKEAIHAKHEAVEGRCAACHMSSAGEEREEGHAYQACFGCHGPKDALVSTACADCHREHGDTWAKPLPEEVSVASTGGPSPWLASFALLGLVGLAVGMHSRGRKNERAQAAREQEEAEAQPPRTDGVVKCGGSGRGTARKLPRVSPNKCTGSGDCADACPYDVLHMVDSIPQVLRPELCHECTTCVAVCGPQALTMAVPGEPPPMISVPDLDANFQTGLGEGEEGVYVIGEASGKPLVKNANNLGRWVVEHMVSEGFGPGSAGQKGFEYEVIVIGSGPAGLSAAMTAQNQGLAYVLLEKGPEFATTIHGYPKKKKLMASPAHVENLGPLPVWDTTREEVIAKWEEELAKYQLQLRHDEAVLSIEQDGPGFLVTTKRGRYRGLRVVIATGTRGDPRKLGKPGDDLPKVLYRLADPDEYDGKDCMVVGGGDSALEAAIALAEAHGGSNRVSIVYRQGTFSRAKTGNQQKVEALVGAGRLTLMMESNPAEVTERSVVVERKDRSKVEVPNDVLFCMLGANPPTKWLEKLGIEIVQKPSDWDPGRSDRFAFKNFSES
ncbi:MAG: NAD(P)-binding domain-containing protein [Deltaproteobacteria bacterium]|nr:NAD(P)-binding domain-containing protein [Deltaproteobacteria bacterium]